MDEFRHISEVWLLGRSKPLSKSILVKPTPGVQQLSPLLKSTRVPCTNSELGETGFCYYASYCWNELQHNLH